MMRQMDKSVIGQEEGSSHPYPGAVVQWQCPARGTAGHGKTRSIKTLSRVLQAAKLGRIQFTPDLLPSDVTGNEIYQDNQGKSGCSSSRGLSSVNWCWRTRSAARPPGAVGIARGHGRRQVTVAGKSYRLPEAVHGAGHAESLIEQGHLPATGRRWTAS